MDEKLLKRCVKYGLKLAGGTRPGESRVSVGMQVERYAASQAHAEGVWAPARKLLCGLGVVPMMFASYRAFVLAVDKRVRRLSGEMMEGEVRLVYQAWVARGLEPGVLRAILEGVFYLDGTALHLPGDAAGL